MLPGAVIDLTEAYISVIMTKCVASVMYCLKCLLSSAALFVISVMPSALGMPLFGSVGRCGPQPTPRLSGEGGSGGENATPAETILKSVRISVPSGPAASLPQIVRVGNGTRRCNMALSLMNY